MIDRDGQYKYSKVVAIDFSGRSATIYPNPVKDVINIIMPSLTNSHSIITIYDGSGKIITKKEVNNLTYVQINISAYPAGVYELEWNNGNQRQIWKITKQ